MTARPRTTRTRTGARVTLALVASALALTACGGSSKSSNSAPAAGTSSGATGGARTLIVGTSNDAPFSFHAAGESTLKGIDGDMIEAIAKSKGWTLKVYDTDFSTLIPALEAKKIDVIVDAMYITDERKKKVDFTNPWYSEGEGIVVRKDDTAVSSAADLKGKVLAAQTGTVYLDYAKTLGAKKLLVLDSQAALLQALKNKQADAVVTDSAVAGYAIAKDPGAGIRLVLPNPAHFPGTIGAAVRKEDTALLAELNAGVAALKASGDDLKILQAYGLGESNRQK
jgi:polar amino acid transport system substrate-binding protein